MQRELVVRARGGDHEALTRLVADSLDRLYALANLIHRDADRAQDAVQEALVSAWRDQRSLRDVEAWDAWSSAAGSSPAVAAPVSRDEVPLDATTHRQRYQVVRRQRVTHPTGQGAPWESAFRGHILP